MRASEVESVNTSPHANNNMDVLALDAPESGNYLVAVGQDEVGEFD